MLQVSRLSATCGVECILLAVSSQPGDTTSCLISTDIGYKFCEAMGKEWAAQGHITLHWFKAFASGRNLDELRAAFLHASSREPVGSAEDEQRRKKRKRADEESSEVDLGICFLPLQVSSEAELWTHRSF